MANKEKDKEIFIKAANVLERLAGQTSTCSELVEYIPPIKEKLKEKKAEARVVREAVSVLSKLFPLLVENQGMFFLLHDLHISLVEYSTSKQMAIIERDKGLDDD